MDQEVTRRLAELTRLQATQSRYPDLRIHVDRWKHERYCAASVNTQVTDYEVHRTCGCCIDAPKIVWFYLQTEHGPIYSDPPQYYLANWKEDGEGYTLIGSFRETALKAGIPEHLVSKLARAYEPEG